LIYEQTPNRLTFESGPDETISHYSDWSSLPAATIRKVNHLRGKAGIALGRKVVLPLDSLAAAAFIRRREENWRAAEEDFYGSYHVSSLEKSVATSGFSVWKLAHEREIPYWLLQKHNANLQLGALHPGDSLNVPVIVPGFRRWAFTRYTGPQDQIRAFAIRLQGPLP